MAISIVDYAVAGGGVAGSSLSVNFASQPASGKPWIIAGGCFFPDATLQISLSAPASLTATQNLDAGGDLAALLSRKLSSGSDGTASTISKSGDIETLAVAGVTLDGVDSHDTSGKATTSSATSLVVSTDASVANANSMALLFIFAQSLSGGYTPTTPTGWTFLAEATTTTASRTNVHVYYKVVGAGALSATWSRSGGASRIKGFIDVWSPAIVPPPTASIDSPPGNVEIYEGDSVVLNGSATLGATPYKNWLWTIVEPSSGVANQTTQNPGAIAFPNNGAWTLRLTVDGDDDQTSSPVDRTITVLTVPNLPPIAEAGPTQFVKVGELVTLDGTGSSDPESDPLTYSWSISEEPAGSSISLSDPAASQPTFTPTHTGNYVFGLIVNDGTSNSPSDLVTIVVSSQVLGHSIGRGILTGYLQGVS